MGSLMLKPDARLSFNYFVRLLKLPEGFASSIRNRAQQYNREGTMHLTAAHLRAFEQRKQWRWKKSAFYRLLTGASRLSI
jgi:protein subunit release factor A